MDRMLLGNSGSCSAAASRWRWSQACGYLDRRVSSRWVSGRAEVKVRHMGHQASRSEIASEGVGSESTSTIVMGAVSVVEAQVAK
jgi:hypothetical protein